jgi:hypothetical protein
MPEPMESFVEWQPPLFLRASEIIHDKRESVGFWALVKIIEIHDFTPCEDSSDDGSRSDSSDDGLPGPQVHSSLRPWPTIYHFIIASSPSRPLALLAAAWWRCVVEPTGRVGTACVQYNGQGEKLCYHGCLARKERCASAAASQEEGFMWGPCFSAGSQGYN